MYNEREGLALVGRDFYKSLAVRVVRFMLRIVVLVVPSLSHFLPLLSVRDYTKVGNSKNTREHGGTHLIRSFLGNDAPSSSSACSRTA